MSIHKLTREGNQVKAPDLLLPLITLRDVRLTQLWYSDSLLVLLNNFTNITFIKAERFFFFLHITEEENTVLDFF